MNLIQPPTCCQANPVIFKVKDREDKFGIVTSEVMQNAELSSDARFLIAMVSTLPPEWEFHIHWLRVHTGWGKDKLQAVMQELGEHHHLHRIREPRVKGRFGWEYGFSIEPQPDLPALVKAATENPALAEPEPENQAIYKKEVQQKVIKQKKGQQQKRAAAGCYAKESKSRFTYDQLIDYSSSLEGVRNPRGLARTLLRTGEADDEVEAWSNARQRAATPKCEPPEVSAEDLRQADIDLGDDYPELRAAVQSMTT